MTSQHDKVPRQEWTEIALGTQVLFVEVINRSKTATSNVQNFYQESVVFIRLPDFAVFL